VGQTIAIIETEGGEFVSIVKEAVPEVIAEVTKQWMRSHAPVDFSDSEKNLSPLVKNIAKEEGVSVAELASISGTGKEGRVTKMIF
jgi:2-oxoglutarate dehydrogenase E2 component (dihydrolipoamide succinyltransferase)